MREFLAMGGYAEFVWPSYAIVFAAVIANIVWARRACRRALEETRRRLAIRAEAP